MEKIAEYFAYSIVIVIVFLKSFFSVYKYVKDFFKKEKNIVIENTIVTEKEKTISISEMFSLLLEQEKILKVLLTLDNIILKKQLDYFEKNINTIKLQVLNEYCVIAYNTQNLSIEQKNLYCNYIELLLKVIVSTIQNYFKYFCKRNNFVLYSVIEFNDEIKKYIQIIFNEIQALLIVHRENFKQFPNSELILKFKQPLESLLIDAFCMARDISIEEHENVNKIKQEFEDRVSTLLQRNYILRY